MSGSTAEIALRHGKKYRCKSLDNTNWQSNAPEKYATCRAGNGREVKGLEEVMDTKIYNVKFKQKIKLIIKRVIKLTGGTLIARLPRGRTDFTKKRVYLSQWYPSCA